MHTPGPMKNEPQYCDQCEIIDGDGQEHFETTVKLCAFHAAAPDLFAFVREIAASDCYDDPGEYPETMVASSLIGIGVGLIAYNLYHHHDRPPGSEPRPTALRLTLSNNLDENIYGAARRERAEEWASIKDLPLKDLTDDQILDFYGGLRWPPTTCYCRTCKESRR